MTLREEILLDKLNSDLLIQEIKLKTERCFMLHIESKITSSIINEIKRQILELTTDKQ